MSLLDKVRLEFDSRTVMNQIKNYNGQISGTQSIYDTDSYLAALGTIQYMNMTEFGFYQPVPVSEAAIKMTPVSSQIYLQSPQFDVVPGQSLNAVFNVARVNAGTMSLDWGFVFTATGGGNVQTVTKGTVTVNATTGKSFGNSSMTVPSGAGTAKFFIYSGAANTPVIFKNLFVALSDTASEVANLTYSEEPAWQNIAADSFSIEADRGNSMEGVEQKMNAGLLTVNLLGAALDPATNKKIAKGRAVRLRGYDGSAWQTVMTGRIATTKTSYPPTGKPRITLTASDVVTDLAKLSPASWFTGDLRYSYEGFRRNNIEYVATDTGGAVAGESAVGQLPVPTSGSWLDQIHLKVNERQGIAYASKSNVVTLAGGTTVPSQSPVATFSDTYADTGAIYYNQDIEVGYDAGSVINSLTVTRTNPGEEDGEFTYGPFKSVKSVNEFGEQDAELNVVAGVPRLHAEYYLPIFAIGQQQVSSLTFNATNSVGKATALEIGQAVRVKFGRIGLNKVYRILGIKHSITPDSWEVTLEFRLLESAPVITIANPTGGPTSGPADLVPPTPGPLAARYRSTNLGIANTTVTNVAFDSADAADQITYDDTNRRFVAPRDGRYQINAGITWSGNATGARYVYVRVNGTNMAATASPPPNAGQFGTVISKGVKCMAGDVIQVAVWQSSGTSLNLIGSSTDKLTYADITYLGT